LRYAPAANWYGTDTFTYTVSDGNGGTDTATVTVVVDAVNDAPTARDDGANTREDSPVVINILANDTDVDGDALTIAGFTHASHGVVTANGDGTLSYAPNADWFGTDSFAYTVSDGNGGTDTATVTVTVESVNDNTAPTANDDGANTREDRPVVIDVLANDTDTDGDALTIADFTRASHGVVTDNGDGTLSYAPEADWHGTDSFTYIVSDGNGGTDAATVTVFVGDTEAPTVRSWHSAANHGPNAGEVLLEITDDGRFTEPRMSGVTKLRIEFSEPIDPGSFGPASVRIVGNDADGLPVLPVDLSGITVTTSTTEGDTVGIIRFSQALPNVARYLVQIEGVADAAGNLLAGDNNRVFSALAGDANGDLRVNACDLSLIKRCGTIQIDGLAEDQARSDINCDGHVNATDLSAAWSLRGANMRKTSDPVLLSRLAISRTSRRAQDAAAEAPWAAATWAEADCVDALAAGQITEAADCAAAPAPDQPITQTASQAPGLLNGQSDDMASASALGSAGASPANQPAAGPSTDLDAEPLDVLALPNLRVLE
ncbi:MAG: tandem-95 repeat protein, partial [Phycisphaerae bacterium]